MVDHVRPAEPDGLAAIQGIRCPRHGRAPDHAVEFHDDLVPRVGEVEAPGRRPAAPPRLAGTCGQAMRPGDHLDVVALEREVNAVAHVAEHLLKQLAAAHPGPASHGRRDVGRGQPGQADRAGDPGVGLLEAVRRGHQVEDRVHEPGARQFRVGHRVGLGLVGAVDDDSGDLAALGRAPPGGHRDVDEAAGLGAEALDLGRGLVAEHRPAPRPADRGPQLGRPRQLTGEGGVHAPVQPLALA